MIAWIWINPVAGFSFMKVSHILDSLARGCRKLLVPIAAFLLLVLLLKQLQLYDWIVDIYKSCLPVVMGAVIAFLLQPLIDRNLKVDILISNPPYIPREEEMEHSVVDYEPHVALFGGDDGLKFYRIIFENAVKVLKERAMMAFEMGYNQKEALSEEAKKYFPNARIEVLKDMSGKNRMLFVYLNMEH